MIYIKNYSPPEYNIKEIFRYAQADVTVTELEPLISSCIDEIDKHLSYKVCYREFPVKADGESLDLGFYKSSSSALYKNLCGCDKIIVFGATIGIELDRRIAKYGTISPVKALVLQAIGTERIEALCDSFCEDLKGEYKYIRPRFSPGYSDLPIDMQIEIFNALDCPRKIGLTLNQSLLMSPSKSVTAIVGISEKPTDKALPDKCLSCDKSNCNYRRVL